MQKVRDHCHYPGKYRGAAHSICILRYTTPKMVPIVFHYGSTYDYHFIIRELAREFKYYLECLGENTEKIISFSVPIKKMVDKDQKDDNDSDNDKNEKNGEDEKKDKDKKARIITYRLRFIDSCRFMQDSLSTLADNLSGINNKVSEIDKKIPHAALIEKFFNTYQLCNNDLNKFALFLRKGIYPYEHMASWKRFKEELLPVKESFYSKLNKEHITDEEYAHAHKVWDTFKIKNLGEYRNLYVQSDTALLADVFESFRDKCLEIDKLDPAHFLSAPGLS